MFFRLKRPKEQRLRMECNPLPQRALASSLPRTSDPQKDDDKDKEEERLDEHASGCIPEKNPPSDFRTMAPFQNHRSLAIALTSSGLDEGSGGTRRRL